MSYSRKATRNLRNFAQCDAATWVDSNKPGDECSRCVHRNERTFPRRRVKVGRCRPPTKLVPMPAMCFLNVFPRRPLQTTTLQHRILPVFLVVSRLARAKSHLATYLCDIILYCRKCLHAPNSTELMMRTLTLSPLSAAFENTYVHVYRSLPHLCNALVHSCYIRITPYR